MSYFIAFYHWRIANWYFKTLPSQIQDTVKDDVGELKETADSDQINKLVAISASARKLLQWMHIMCMGHKIYKHWGSGDSKCINNDNNLKRIHIKFVRILRKLLCLVLPSIELIDEDDMTQILNTNTLGPFRNNLKRF